MQHENETHRATVTADIQERRMQRQMWDCGYWGVGLRGTGLFVLGFGAED